jgi:hypothetical protein
MMVATGGLPTVNTGTFYPVPNRGIADCPNRGKIYVDGVPRGRADTPGFYRQPEIEGQQVTEFGVPPLPQNTQHEARRRIERASCFSWERSPAGASMHAHRFRESQKSRIFF